MSWKQTKIVQVLFFFTETFPVGGTATYQGAIRDGRTESFACVRHVKRDRLIVMIDTM